uniref:histidine kinase n=1 Tax=Chromera velia CCMP2878 TaxID=1169474 RepID=A0A0G4GFX7_9ALVE|eukprot:Cvel_4654.t1-p1 / transcript=Cvel_4654.t1 / gene=Cvel_4654 / organism=Chromera_velia_CCMP2878 / gene_product=Hybrid signal transduction histidine kinase G, putative / transcript_product=Hybrid signal transduction histidine kinase G, putative / location=Cvel_scaffold205:76555-78909(-) / protein_length=785 / sequence_SO=supercontig / SO=protein_coding / is_pseudo=false
MNLHFSYWHFMTLNLVDSTLWTLSGVYAASLFTGELEKYSTEFAFYQLTCVLLPFLIAIALRRLPLKSLSESDSDAEKEVQQRVSAEQSRDAFLSYIMHEMRNPMSGASLLLYEFLESLKELGRQAIDSNMKTSAQKKEEDKEHSHLKKFAETAQKESARLRRLAAFMATQIDKMKTVCDDVLQLEKISKGKFEYNFVPTRLRDWAERAAAQGGSLFSPQGTHPSVGEDSVARRQGTYPSVRFEWALSVSPEAEEVLSSRPLGVADFSRLEQVISNLLSNAKKFTPQGSVHLKFEVRLPTPAETSAADNSESTSRSASMQMKRAVELEASRSEGKEVRCPFVVLHVAVTDTGAGLSQEDSGKLFRPYGQVRAGELQNGGGTGLGLCICKSFVEAHAGGSVGVESQGRGEGSSFFFTIFVPVLDSSHAPSSCMSPARGGSLGGGGSPAAAAACPERSFPNDTEISQKEKETENEKVSPSQGRPSRFCRGVASSARTPMVSPLLQMSAEEVPSPFLGRQKSGIAASLEKEGECEGKRERKEQRGEGEEGSLPSNLENEKRTDAVPLSIEEIPVSRDMSPSSPQINSSSSSAALRVNPGDHQQSETPQSTPEITSSAKAFRDPASVTTSAPNLTADVLLVDDDRFCLMAGSAAIRRLGFSVHTAEDGDEACDLVISQNLFFRFILTDKNMARMEGPEAVRRMVSFFDVIEKETEGSSMAKPRPFIVGCTGDATPEAQAEFLKAGADRVIFKPLQASKLAKTLRELENRPREDRKAVSGSVSRSSRSVF